MIWKVERGTSHRADRDRSRHQNRRGYPLRSGSGCRIQGVQLRPTEMIGGSRILGES